MISLYRTDMKILIAFPLMILLSLLIVGGGCRSTTAPSPTVPVEPEGELGLTSSAFNEGENIPREYTCEGNDVSPPLSWSGVPKGAQSLVLIADDPDAPGGTWVHWVIYDIPTDRSNLPQDVEKSDAVAGIGKQGRNDFGAAGYGGPCPPPGSTHRYFFKLYVIDSTLDLNPGASKEDVVEAMEGHILAQTQLMGRFGR